ncbi:MAG TPA: asparagine synthase (glutamine-hydrolyzing) [Planctomycetota bacterium]
MCGICGLVGFPPGPGRDALIAAMSESLGHRGPDGARAWSESGAALGFRRLAVIDVEGGMQPMTSEDGSLQLVLNGEIYNHLELRGELEARGHRFRSRCDAEAALHLLEQEGREGIARLHGMFALAVWNRRDGSLLVARDRHGEKPLVYWHDGGRFAFASEIQALLRIPEVGREIDADSIGAYLATGVVGAPRTMLRSVRKLPPGHWGVFKNGRFELGTWPEPPPPPEPLDRETARQWVRAEVTRAVESRLVADVPLGAFLSGGVDSSIVVGLMAARRPDPVPTFTATFSDAAFDEGEAARAVARHFRTDHHEFRATPDAAELLPRIVRHFGEPFADPAALPTWELARLTARHVKVAMSGDGADECFGGYLRHRAIRLLAQVRRLPAPVRWLAKLVPVGRAYRERTRSLLSRAGLPLAVLYAEMTAPADAATRRRLFPGPVPVLKDFDGPDPVTAAGNRDLRSYLPDDLLVKTDIASMAHGLEVRCPFVDPALVRGSRVIPGRWKIEGRTTKAVLRDAFRDLLPPETLRRKKHGFGVPLDAWLRGPLRELRDDHLRDRGARRRGIFDPVEVDRLLREHDQGADHGRILWALLVFEAWKRWLDRERP